MARASKVNDMPPEVRAWLEQALIDRNFSRYKELEALMKERGFDISHASIHRHGVKLERKLNAIKASTETAKLIAESAPDVADNRSAAVISLIQTGLFDALLDLQEAEETEDPGKKIKLLGGAAVAFAKLATASVQLKRWQDEVIAKLASLQKDGPKKGEPWLTPDAFEHIKRMVYGIR